MTSPTEGATVQDVVFDWQPVAGAISYDIRVSTDDSFNTVIDHPVVRGHPLLTVQVLRRGRLLVAGAGPQHLRRGPGVDRRPGAHLPPGLGRGAEAALPRGHGESRGRRRLLLPVDPGDARHQVPPRRRPRPQLLPDVVQVVRGHADHLHALRVQVGPGSGGLDPCAPHPGVTTYWRVKALDGPPGPTSRASTRPIRAFVYDPGRVRQVTPAEGPPSTFRPLVGSGPRRRRSTTWCCTPARARSSTSPPARSHGRRRARPAPRPPRTRTAGPWSRIDHNGDKSPLPCSVTAPSTCPAHPHHRSRPAHAADAD